MADVPVFEWKGVSIATMSNDELLTAIKENEKSRNYPDSATMILLVEAGKRVLGTSVESEKKQAEERQRVVAEMLAGTEDGDDLDGGNE